MKRYLLLLAIVITQSCPIAAHAFPLSITKDVREDDWDMTAYVRTLSGTPTVTITSQLCDEQLVDSSVDCSDPFTEGTLSSSTKKLVFRGPMTKLTATIPADTGHVEVFFCGRISP